jgi:hypothetical protein
MGARPTCVAGRLLWFDEARRFDRAEQEQERFEAKHIEKNRFVAVAVPMEAHSRRSSGLTRTEHRAA